jgi:hypothetical protein
MALRVKTAGIIDSEAHRDDDDLIDVNLCDFYIVGKFAFSNCANVVRVDMSSPQCGLKYINQGTFKGCTALRDVLFPAALEEIHEEAFAGCGRIAAIVLPGSVRVVGNDAFRNCTSLAKVTMHKGVSCANTAFKDCARGLCIRRTGTAPSRTLKSVGATDLQIETITNLLKDTSGYTALLSYIKTPEFLSSDAAKRGFNDHLALAISAHTCSKGKGAGPGVYLREQLGRLKNPHDAYSGTGLLTTPEYYRLLAALLNNIESEPWDTPAKVEDPPAAAPPPPEDAAVAAPPPPEVTKKPLPAVWVEVGDDVVYRPDGATYRVDAILPPDPEESDIEIVISQNGEERHTYQKSVRPVPSRPPRLSLPPAEDVWSRYDARLSASMVPPPPLSWKQYDLDQAVMAA